MKILLPSVPLHLVPVCPTHLSFRSQPLGGLPGSPLYHPRHTSVPSLIFLLYSGHTSFIAIAMLCQRKEALSFFFLAQYLPRVITVRE